MSIYPGQDELNAQMFGDTTRDELIELILDALQVIADLTTQLDAYKLIAGRLANTLDRVHYELPTGQDWSISQVLAAYEELNDC